MKHGPNIARIAALIAEPARAEMLTALLDGRALRKARVCYDHLAGALAVMVFGRLRASGSLTSEPDGLALGGSGAARFAALGVDVAVTFSAVGSRTCAARSRSAPVWIEPGEDR
ncbi:MAG: hypothetical protein ABI809_06140 [Caldimonas sp.]